MAIGSIKLVRTIQGLASPTKKSDSGAIPRKGSFRGGLCKFQRTASLAQLSQEERSFYLTGRKSKSQRRASTFGQLPSDIPHGCFAVYVGEERRRYVISTSFLSHSLFKQLLKRSEEKFGFQYEGGLNVACESELFEHLLWLIITRDPSARNSLQDHVDNFYDTPF